MTAELTPSVKRRSALEGFRLPQTDAMRAEVCDFATRFVLRGGPEIAAPLATAFGVSPPMRPLRSENSGPRSALWLGPDEWLLVAEDRPVGLFASCTAALTDRLHSLVDVSHARCALDLSGSKVERWLNAGVALDLDERAFPLGMVVRTLYVKAEVVLWRRASGRFRIETGRSFGPYLATLLMQAADGLSV